MSLLHFVSFRIACYAFLPYFRPLGDILEKCGSSRILETSYSNFKAALKIVTCESDREAVWMKYK